MKNVINPFPIHSKQIRLSLQNKFFVERLKVKLKNNKELGLLWILHNG